MSDNQLRDRVWDALHRTAEQRTPDRVDTLVDLINEEKSKSYGLGYQDGQRRRAQLH